MAWGSVKDWFWVIIAVGLAVLPPGVDPLIRAKARREWPDKDWEKDRGFSSREWSLFVAVIAIVVMLAVAFAISVTS